MAIPSDLTVHPNLLEVALPTGGRAWVRRRLTHEQTYLRQAELVKLTASLPPEVVALDIHDQTTLERLAFEGVDTSGVIKAFGDMKTAIVAACVWGWDGVRGPDGDDLASPADAARMDEEDLDALFTAQEAALESADPNAGRDRSSPLSRRRRPIPAGRSRSMRPG